MATGSTPRATSRATPASSISLVGGVRLAAGALGRLDGHGACCSGVPSTKSYAPGLPILDQLALGARDVEHRAQLAVAAGLLVVARRSGAA